MCTLHASQTGSSDCFVGWSQGSPRWRVPMAQQCNRSAERQHQGIFPFAAVVAVVEAPSLRCFQHVQGRETRPSLRLNLCMG